MLDSANGVDFGDMIAFCVRLFREFPDLRAFYQDRYRFILVDEYQDTNRAQYEFVRQLAEGRGNVCVVGDDDQSIYTWRGADIRNILDFEAQFADARVIRLERNYRSTGNILASANAVISKVANRAEKTLWTERDDGQQPEIIEAFDEDDEARQVGNLIRELRGEDVPSHDIAIIYRTNAQSRPLEEWFVRQGLPYQLVGATEFYGRREVRDVLGYLRAIANPRDLVSFERIANTPRRGIGAKTLQVLREWAEDSSRSSGELTRLLAADADSGQPIQHTLDNPLPTRATRALIELGRLLRRLDTLADEVPVGGLVNAVVRESGYDDVLDNDPDSPEERWENVVELQTAASKYDGLGPRESLSRYLSEAALVADVDNLATGGDAVTLLTAHSAKGLEFGVVILVGTRGGALSPRPQLRRTGPDGRGTPPGLRGAHPRQGPLVPHVHPPSLRLGRPRAIPVPIPAGHSDGAALPIGAASTPDRQSWRPVSASTMTTISLSHPLNAPIRTASASATRSSARA